MSSSSDSDVTSPSEVSEEEIEGGEGSASEGELTEGQGEEGDGDEAMEGGQEVREDGGREQGAEVEPQPRYD